MSVFVLDTDILSLYQEGHATVREHIAATPPTDLAITILSVEEQLSGWYTYLRRATQIENVAAAYQGLTDTTISFRAFAIFTFDRASILRYGSIRKLKLNVRKMDVRIAAVVLEKNAVLVTRNARDFKHVPGLSIADWSV
jgi:tRNA(fMet)-specific endonuclease VapC